MSRGGHGRNGLFLRTKQLQNRPFGQTPHSPSQRVGRRPLSGTTPTANAAPCPQPCGLRPRFPRCLVSLRSPATRRHARHETRFAELVHSLPRWQSASSPPTRAGRRFSWTSRRPSKEAPSALYFYFLAHKVISYPSFFLIPRLNTRLVIHF